VTIAAAAPGAVFAFAGKGGRRANRSTGRIQQPDRRKRKDVPILRARPDITYRPEPYTQGGLEEGVYHPATHSVTPIT
jgi:hypothetical protein